MRSSGWTPSIVPNGDDQTVFLVKDDLGRLGAVWREADAETRFRPLLFSFGSDLQGAWLCITCGKSSKFRPN